MLSFLKDISASRKTATNVSEAIFTPTKGNYVPKQKRKLDLQMGVDALLLML